MESILRLVTKDAPGPPKRERTPSVNIEMEDIVKSELEDCEMCFICVAPRRSCGHIVCPGCAEENIAMTRKHGGAACPICVQCKEIKEKFKNDPSVLMEVSWPVTTPRTGETEKCKFCNKEVLPNSLSYNAIRECGHFMCKDCLNRYPERHFSTYACKFCQQLGIINGDTSKKEKKKAMKTLQDAQDRGERSGGEPIVFERLPDAPGAPGATEIPEAPEVPKAPKAPEDSEHEWRLY